MGVYIHIKIYNGGGIYFYMYIWGTFYYEPTPYFYYIGWGLICSVYHGVNFIYTDRGIFSYNILVLFYRDIPPLFFNNDTAVFLY